MKMKKIVLIIAMVMLVACGQSASNASKTIGVIQWADHPALNDSLTGMQEALKEAGVDGDFDIIVKNANGESATALTIAKQFVADGVDAIYAIATPAAQSALTAIGKQEIPLIFSAVTDPQAAGLVLSPENPEGFVTGVSDLPPLEKQVSLMKEIFPNLKQIGVLFNIGEVNSTNQIKDLKEIASRQGISISELGVSSPNEIAIATDQLASSVDVMFIINDNMIASATSLVVERSTRANKPVFMAEEGQFDKGVFATESISYKNLGKQAGLMILDILNNAKPIASIPVEISKDTQLIVSKKMADKLNITLPQSVLDRAEIRD